MKARNIGNIYSVCLFMMVYAFLVLCGVESVYAEEQNKTMQGNSPDVLEIISEIELAGRKIDREINNLPSMIDQEHAKMLSALDKWANTELAKTLVESYEKVESELNATSLPENEGTFSFWWKTTGLSGKDAVEKMAKDFVNSFSPKLSEIVEEITIQINDQLEEVGERLLSQAEENIRRPFVEILKTRLPIYNTIPLPRTGEMIQKVLFDDVSDNFNRRLPVRGALGLGMVLTPFLMKKVLKKISVRLTKKVAGKVLGKFIPIIGWVLLVWEGMDMVTAKADFEDQLRQMYLEEYRNAFTVQSVWWEDQDGNTPSLRAALSTSFKDLLVRWENRCRAEVASRRDSAYVLAISPSAQTYMQDELKRGKSSEDLLEEMGELWSVFGVLTSQAPVENLKSIWIAAPDQKELRILSEVMGISLLEQYDMYGKYFLDGVHAIGVDNYLSSQAWRSLSVDWRVVTDKIKYIPGLSENRDAVEGLYVLICENVPWENLSTDLLAVVGRKGKLFKSIWNAVEPDIKKMERVMGDKTALDKIEESFKNSEEVSSSFLKAYSAEFWSIRSKEDIRDLIEITKFRMEKLKKPIELAMIEEQDRGDFLEVYRKAGSNGMELWEIYATKEAGPIGKDRARRSIAYLADGYPFEDLRDEKKLNAIIFYEKIPIVGKLLYLHRSFVPFVLIVIAVLFLLPLVRRAFL